MCSRGVTFPWQPAHMRYRLFKASVMRLGLSTLRKKNAVSGHHGGPGRARRGVRGSARRRWPVRPGQPSLLTLSRFCFAMYASCKSGFSSASFFSSDSVFPIWPDNEIISEKGNYFLPPMQETRGAGRPRREGQPRGDTPPRAHRARASVSSSLMALSEFPPRGGDGRRLGQAPGCGKRPVRAARPLFRTFRAFCKELLCEGKEKALLKKIII